MKEKNKVKKLILIPLLITNLVVFNFPLLPVLAEESDPCDNQTEETVNNGDGGNGGDTIIETGDADIQVDVQNEVNTNETNLQGDNSQPENTDVGSSTSETTQETTQESTSTEETILNEEATSTEETILTEENNSTSVEVINDNEAEVENNAAVEGESGENEAQSNEGNAIIDTGDVNIVFGLVNTVNTNIVQSNFSQFLINLFQKLQGNINLENEFNTASSTEKPCCFDLDVVNNNNGEINNEILIDGSSGSNSAQSQNRNAHIKTGNVNVSASIFNLLNSNIIGSNWSNLIINIFDEWTGDLILPGKDKMKEFLNPYSGNGLCGEACRKFILNSNEGQVENEVYINADTGRNQADGDSSAIRTGDANAKNDIFNLVNTNVINDNWFFMAVNVFGQWQGNVFSLPPGFKVADDFRGIKIYNLDSEEFNDPTGNSSLNVINDNTGTIKNSVIINVSSGDNLAVANNGQAIIETGDVNAFANLINILNSNLIGSNWLTGVINVFGNWQGDLAFGQPDLWLGESAVLSPDPAAAGGKITYTLTYANYGDADATEVVLLDDFDEELLAVVNPGSGVVINNPGEMKWNLGTIPAGSSGSVSYSVMIDPELPYGTTEITNQASITSLEDDKNGEDNIDSLSIKVNKAYPILQSVFRFEGVFLPDLKIKKTSNVEDFIYPGNEVDYTIQLFNNDSDGAAYNVVVEDVLLNESSEVINTYKWNLGTVYPREEIIIEYTAAIGSEIPAGLYTNFAQAKGLDIRGDSAVSLQASVTIEVRMPAPSLEDIDKEVKEIENKIEKIREEIKRFIPPKPPSESLVTQISQILVKTVSAQEEITPPLNKPEIMGGNVQKGESKQGLEKLLATVSNFFYAESLLWVLAGLVIILMFLFFSPRKKENI